MQWTLHSQDTARVGGSGADRRRISPEVLLRIVLPLAGVGILTVALLGFMAFWGEYGFASIIVETHSKYTATIGLVRQMTTMGVAFNVIGGIPHSAGKHGFMPRVPGRPSGELT